MEIAEAVANVAEAIILAWSMMVASPEPVVISYYGTESDGFLGQYHGAYWNGYDCNLPDVVDKIHHGIAAPRWIPYCTEVTICYGEACVVTTVVDRMADNTKNGMSRVDVWPAVAVVLGMVDAGIVIGDMYDY